MDIATQRVHTYLARPDRLWLQHFEFTSASTASPSGEPLLESCRRSARFHTSGAQQRFLTQSPALYRQGLRKYPDDPPESRQNADTSTST